MTEYPVYAKVNLQETKYKPGFRNLDYKLLPKDTDPAPLLEIYRQYAIYKKFQSTWPIYPDEFSKPYNDVIAYYDKGEIVAWTIIFLLAKNAVRNMQFAWNYHDPKLKLGYKSIRNECGIYRLKGYKEMLIDQDQNYKKLLQGYAEFGPMT